MTQEQKELLLKDLCGRLPYGVKVEYYDPEAEKITFNEIDTIYNTTPIDNVEVGVAQYGLSITDVKPYLLPLSSMTLEQRCKVQSLLLDKCTISFKNSEFEFYGEDYHTIKLEQFEKLFNLFNMWHLDYRGLIPMGLAEDATGLNIY